MWLDKDQNVETSHLGRVDMRSECGCVMNRFSAICMKAACRSLVLSLEDRLLCRVRGGFLDTVKILTCDSTAVARQCPERGHVALGPGGLAARLRLAPELGVPA
jgi:hypothetical protein